MNKRLMTRTTLLWISVFLAGCLPQAPLVTNASPTMQEIFHEIDPSKPEMRIQTPQSDDWIDTTPFARLANPRLHMYVFPHLATRSRIPIPGYWTVFPLYDHIEYALPGEPTEADVNN